ncbi:MAG TPA: hypothetical protein VF450_16955, partial [Noviherbaspirillum sp.]
HVAYPLGLISSSMTRIFICTGEQTINAKGERFQWFGATHQRAWAKTAAPRQIRRVFTTTI